MKRQEKADRIGAILAELFPRPPIPLTHSDPYTLLIAVLLSAQCTDERVNKVTPGLFAIASTPKDMARVPVPTILNAIRSCGLAPGKAQRIQALSVILVEQFAGVVPADFAALERLPGVGHKTAGVVMAQAFGVPAFPVDTHIHRLASRWGLSRAQNVSQTERDLKRVFPQESWNNLHLQMIYFGRQYCPARTHDLSTCPICGWAASQQRIRQERAKRVGGHAPT